MGKPAWTKDHFRCSYVIILSCSLRQIFSILVGSKSHECAVNTLLSPPFSYLLPIYPIPYSSPENKVSTGTNLSFSFDDFQKRGGEVLPGCPQRPFILAIDIESRVFLTNREVKLMKSKVAVVLKIALLRSLSLINCRWE